MPITSRITSTGTFYTTGQIDEATFNPNSGYLKNQAANTAGNPWSFWGSTSNIIISTNEPAPDGTFTAVRFRPTGQYQGGRTLNASWLPNVIQTGSVWCKVDSGTQLMVIGLNGGGISTYFTANSTWQRFVSGPYVKYVSYLDYFAIGTFNTSGFQDFILWGPQVELGNVATAYEATDSTGKPALKTANKIDSNGNYYITGTFDEIAYNKSSGYNNLFSNTASFSSVNWQADLTTRCRLLLNTPETLAPDGTQTAAKLVDIGNTGSAFHSLNYNSLNLELGKTYTYSVYAKAAELTSFAIYPNGGNYGGQFNLATGAPTNRDPNITTTMTAVGNGWYRCVATYVSQFSATTSVNIYLLNPGTNYIATGNQGVYIWGPQYTVNTTGANTFPYIATSANATPVNNITKRVDPQGNDYVVSNYDEVTYNPNSGVITNYYQYSTFNGITWVNTTYGSFLPTTETLAPDNSSGAYKLVPNSGSDPNSGSSLGIVQNNGFNNGINAGATYTQSIYFKPAGFNSLRIRNNSDGLFFDFTPSVTPVTTGSCVNPSLQSVGNGWYRASWSFVAGQIGGVGGRSDNWSFRTTSVGNGKDGIYVWGPQLQAGPTLTEYVVTGANGIPIPQ